MAEYFKVQPHQDVLIKGTEMQVILDKLEQLPISKGMPIFDEIQGCYSRRHQEQQQAQAEQVKALAEKDALTEAGDRGRLEAVRNNGQAEPVVQPDPALQ